VHISALSREFVKDPRQVVKPGEIVKVKVLEVDVPRKRIALSMRLDDTGSAPRSQPGRDRAPAPAPNAREDRKPQSAAGNAFADAFRKAGIDGSKPARR
jgi:uncharacterized protein